MNNKMKERKKTELTHLHEDQYDNLNCKQTTLQYENWWNLPFRRWPLERSILKWKKCNSYFRPNGIDLRSRDSNWQPALVQIMVRRLFGAKPLPAPMLALLTNTYIYAHPR